MFYRWILVLLILTSPPSPAATTSADAGAWQLWLKAPAAQTADVAAPTIVRTAPAADAAWLERWSGIPPSLAWNDIALELVVKYQQNPLRAARMLALLHTSLHDALVLCARERCSPAQTRVAMHAAAGHVLAHMYPQETPGRLQALAVSA